VHHGWYGTHRYDIQLVATHPWCTHRTSLVVKKNFLIFPVVMNNSIKGRSFGFLVINVCNHGEHYETPCIVALSRNVYTSSAIPTAKSNVIRGQHSILCQILTETGIPLQILIKHQCKFSYKFIQWGRGHTDRLTDTTKLIGAFRDYAETPKMSAFCPHIAVVWCKDLRMKSHYFPIQR
jgi:hypothetical protein